MRAVAPATHKLILASSSPRRRQLLDEADYTFDVVPPVAGDDVAPLEGESTREFVARTALAKARDVGQRIERGTVLACDTVVECGGRLLGKPADEADARRMLEQLSGREHRVYTGLCLWPRPDGRPRLDVDVTCLRMDTLSPAEIDDYLASGAWRGKAGAFGYQDRHGWLHVVAGSESNVVGLPLELLERMLGDLCATEDHEHET